MSFLKLEGSSRTVWCDFSQEMYPGTTGHTKSSFVSAHRALLCPAGVMAFMRLAVECLCRAPERVCKLQGRPSLLRLTVSQNSASFLEFWPNNTYKTESIQHLSSSLTSSLHKAPQCLIWLVTFRTDSRIFCSFSSSQRNLSSGSLIYHSG